MPEPTTSLVIHPLSGIEVFYAPVRASRTNAFTQALELPKSEGCPFCPGHEEETPHEVAEWFLQPGDTQWQVRVVPNKFPIVNAAGPLYGMHEVLVETPQHHATWLTMSQQELTLMLVATVQQMVELYQDKRIKLVQVFKNVGSRAGSSLAHPHSQILALSMVPQHEQQYRHRARAYRQQHGITYDATLVREAQHVVHADDQFMTLCPPISRMPYEMWVIPRQTQPLERLTASHLSHLAHHLQKVLSRLQATVGPVAHNVVWHTPPSDEPLLLERIEIIPRMTTWAGLELRSGFYVNPILPSLAAARLQAGMH